MNVVRFVSNLIIWVKHFENLYGFQGSTMMISITFGMNVDVYLIRVHQYRLDPARFSTIQFYLCEDYTYGSGEVTLLNEDVIEEGV